MQKQEDKVKTNNIFPEMENEVLNFWESAKTFQKSLERDAPKGDYIFYDGPPFGTGEPHYGHILSSVSKDVVPRFWTMNGYHVERKWGWDCHGLPIENIIEADMKISGKKQIEDLGIDRFNEACRSRVLEYTGIWDVMIKRIGRWVDFKNSYKTMDKNYMESVWWAFKEMWKKNLVYEGRKVLLYCPRCETPISNFEVAMDNSYKDVSDTSIFVKFKISSAKEKLDIDDDVYFLVWTTTPWTLPGNVALAVGENIDYALIETDKKTGSDKKQNKSQYLILAKDRIDDVVKKKSGEFKIVKEFKGSKLLGVEYEPLLNIPAMTENSQKAYYVVSADFVTIADGTGIVHIAPVYGEDDHKIGLKFGLPIVPMLDEKGHFNNTVSKYKGEYFKAVNKMIVEELEVNNRSHLFDKQLITHSYPHCHRCNTALFYNAIPAWFINIDKIRKRMLELNENINWYPEHLKHGRFSLGITQAPDWNISRNRYFATPMPIWKCDKCDGVEILGSVEELEQKGGKGGITDIHSHFIDGIHWECLKCKGNMKRVKEVFDCWVESGSMPFAQMHYPFENKEKFEANFPSKFISEYISQTRAWFYVMHVIATALFNKNSFENVVTTGIILNEKGEKMSKSKKNFPNPWKVINDFGADALRLYFMGSAVMHAENLFFNETELKDMFRKNLMTLWNVYKFFELFTVDTAATPDRSSTNILDKWILARLNQLTEEITKQMNAYDLPRSVRPITDFINDLSTWYLRRSRDRFKSNDETDKNAAISTTAFVFIELSKVMAPFMPFIAEQLWQKVSGNNFENEDKSVHLEAWPDQLQIANDELRILDEMEVVRKVVEQGLAAREICNFKIKQPLNELRVGKEYFLKAEYLELIRDELNVKTINNIDEVGVPDKNDSNWFIFSDVKGLENYRIYIDIKITPELKMEGVKRELVRFINALRKDLDMTIQDRAEIYYHADSQMINDVFEKFGEEIKKDTLSEKIIKGVEDAGIKKEVKIDGETIVLGIEKIK